MTERLNNEQISQRIMDTNSDLKRYLNLAPELKIAPAIKPSSSKASIPLFSFPRPILRP